MPDQPVPTSRRAPPRDPNRPSLREIAERSAAAMPRSRPGAPRSAPASAPSRPATGQPARDEENTGYVEVGALRELYLASTRPRPESVTSDDEATRAYCPVPPPSQTQLAYTRSEPPARAARAAAGRRASGVVIGAAIALAGIAASAVWVARTRAARMEAAAVTREAAAATLAPAAADAPSEALPQAPAAEEQPVEATAPAATPASAEEQGGEIRLGELPSTSMKRDESNPSTSAARGAPAAANAAAPARGRPATGAAKAAVAPPPGKPSDSASAIAAAAAAGPATPPPPEPAAPPAAPAKAPPAAGGQEQPAQAAVRAAVNAVKGGAKACLAEADDATRASITFASSGTVSNVSVTGWAADAGVAGCVKSALKGARVEPFAGPSFTVSVTLRP